MARSDYSRYDDEPRRSQGGLSLSTGRFDGRSTGTTRSSSSSGNRPRGTRHNPLRDEYPSSRDRRREPEPGRRHSGGERSTRGEQPRGKQTPAGNRGAQGRPRNGASSGRGSHAPRAGAAFAPQMHTLAPAGGFNLARAAMALIAIALAVIFAMALFHIGPFASAAAKDGSKHVGVASANAVGGNASYFAQNVATQVSLARPVEPELAQLPAYTPTRDDLTNLAGQKAPFAFALGNATNDAGEQAAAPVLSDRSLVSLNNALSYYDNNGYEASYLIMDLGTGRGIAGNVDVPIYGASSFKGPYCAYVVNKEFPNDIDRASSSRLTQVENTIVWSDNSSYGKLRRTYGNDGMEAWLAEAGVDELALTLRANDNWVSTLAPAIAEDWKAVGVTAEVVLLDTTALFADLSTEPEPGTLLPFDVVLSPGDPSCFGNDADLIISWWYGDNVWTRARSRWATTPAFAEVAELLAEARSKTSEDEQQPLWNQCFDIIAAEVPLYPLFHRETATAWWTAQLDDYDPISATGLNFLGTTPMRDADPI